MDKLIFTTQTSIFSRKGTQAVSVILMCILLVSVDAYLATTIGCIGALLIVWAEFKSLGSLGFTKSLSRKKLWTRGSMVVLLLLPFSIVLAHIIPALTGASINYSIFDQLRGNTSAYLVTIPVIWIVAGFFEEIIFRGFLYQQLIRLFGESKLALILIVLGTSAFFGHLHDYQGISGQILTGVIGAILGIIFLTHKRNLWLTIIIHGLYDTLALTLVYLNLDRFLL